jgi:hypothetical protein
MIPEVQRVARHIHQHYPEQAQALIKPSLLSRSTCRRFCAVLLSGALYSSTQCEATAPRRQTGNAEFKVADLLRDQSMIPEVQRVARHIHQHYTQIYQQLFAGWPAEERAELTRLLQRFVGDFMAVDRQPRFTARSKHDSGSSARGAPYPPALSRTGSGADRALGLKSALS